MTLQPSPGMGCDGMPVGEDKLEGVILIYLLRDTKEIVTKDNDIDGYFVIDILQKDNS